MYVHLYCYICMCVHSVCMSMYVYVCTCMSVQIILRHLYFVNKNLPPVTQLYIHVSIDASTKESLKKTDRPLFREFFGQDSPVVLMNYLKRKGDHLLSMKCIVN